MTEAQAPEETAEKSVWFIYDGECPICQIGASMHKVRAEYGKIQTIDARNQADHPVMIEACEKGYDLDQGMVIKYDGVFYQGKSALTFMARSGADIGTLNRANNFMFRSNLLATLCYPFMKLGRNIALFFKGVGKIKNLEKMGDDS